jgi:hypothetical protein
MAMADRTQLDDEALEQFFAAGRAAAPKPSTALTYAVTVDALAAQDRRATPAAPTPLRDSRWRALFAGFGGWPALGGMATAALTGLWIGVAGIGGVDPVALWTGAENANAGNVDLLGDSFATALDIGTEG